MKWTNNAFECLVRRVSLDLCKNPSHIQVISQNYAFTGFPLVEKKKKNVLLLETKNHVTIGKRFWRCDRNQSDAPHNIADVCVESIVVCLNCRSFCRFALFSIFCWATFFIVQLLCMRLCRSVCLLLSGICSFVSPSCLKLVCPACMYRMSASCHSDELVVNQVCSGVILSLL